MFLTFHKRLNNKNKNKQMRSLNEHMEELNELSLETYAKAIQKAQGRGSKQSKNIEKLALELIKRGETEKVKDKKGDVNKLVLPDGNVEYVNNKGQLHRVNGPAIEWPNGSKLWYLNGDFHREDGPAIEYSNGEKEWFLNGKHHREDGPAVERPDGYKAWYLNGKLHRDNGPAVEWPNEEKEWYLDGDYYSRREFNIKMNR